VARAPLLALALAGCTCGTPVPADAGPADAGGDAPCIALDDAIDPPVITADCDPALGCPAGARCWAATGECICPLGSEGAGCDECAAGFVRDGERCRLERDGAFDHWPNAVSAANSDPWIAAHHTEIRTLRPRLLVLDFANPGDPARTASLIDSIRAAFREASRPGGAGAPQLDFELVAIRDLRDGAGGRPPPPPGWPYENSTLLPRRPDGEPGAWRVDYATFFEDAFAAHLGLLDAAGAPLPLCDALDRGLLHELWIVGSGDVPDANAAEVLATSPVYTPEGTRIPGISERCAGNGCFDPDVPFCGRTLRIGFVNYTRGPGCYVHSMGHAMESSGRRWSMPAWREWWLPFVRFDLRDRWSLPFDDLYAMSCTDAEMPCLRLTSPSSAEIRHAGGTYAVGDFDPACGNVHFPPNGASHYDYASAAEVRSSCERFGRPLACGEDRRAPVSSATWSHLEPFAPDCGGAFLVWWMQRMPAHGSGQAFPDGRAMPSVWPFLFY
jgi:hypothetical protein